MADFSYRIRFRLPKEEALGVDALSWTFGPPSTPASITLKSLEGSPIKDSRKLAICSGGWNSEEEASHAGQQCKDALALTMVRLGGAVDFEERRPQGMVTQAGLAMLEKLGRRVLADQPGLMVYETEPPPHFASAHADAFLIQSAANFERVFGHALRHPWQLTDRERLCLDLYNASFFEISPHARFLTLVMAVEALLEPEPRPEGVRAHVERMILLTKADETLPHDQKMSLLGSLQLLLHESIRQAGRKLAERLGTKSYGGQSAPKFFTDVYDLRSNLVHGKERQPSLNEVIETGSNLRMFVSDLLTGPLAAIEL